jgi:hypothetical protein
MLEARANLRYLSYVLRHKWHVYRAGRRFGLGRWHLITHDLSKFSRAEWGPYVRKFGGPTTPRDKTGAYDPNAQGEEFKAAWRHHWQNNPHHWEYWAEGFLNPVPMHEIYAREMVADWIGAGKAQGKPDVKSWYAANGGRMCLHPETRKQVEYLLAEVL